jgi:hypothetical protein
MTEAEIRETAARLSEAMDADDHDRAAPFAMALITQFLVDINHIAADIHRIADAEAMAKKAL